MWFERWSKPFKQETIKVKIATFIFRDQVRKQNFQSFHVCTIWYFFKGRRGGGGVENLSGRDLGTECIVTAVFQP